MDPAAAWPVLSITERRVLGVLVEKQKTTDTYPLTINAVVTGCNQKSNRDPILNLDDLQAEEALTSAQKKGLVMRIISGRVDKWKHLLYDAWKVSSPELAVIAELLLRGPQTEGELRSRASRMDDIPDLGQLRAIVKSLAERKLVIYLTPEERRGAVLTHGFHDPRELEHLQTIHAQGGATMTEPGAGVFLASAAEPGAGPDHQTMVQLREELDSLRQQVHRLSQMVEQLQKELGIAIPKDSISVSPA